MEYRVLGRSGLRVSEISLGCWAIGGPSWRDGSPVGWSGSNDDDSLAGLRRAFELGINHFDTADVYGDGHSERLIGRFLKEVPRDRIVVATKVGWFRGTAPNAMQPETNLFQWADAQNLGMVMFGPLAQGILLDKFDPENPPQFGEGDIRRGNQAFTRERLLAMRRRLQPLKERFGGEVPDLARVALQYALSRSPNAGVIPGFKHARQVESNAQAAGRPLSGEELAFIKTALQGA
jgi:aryl-alcohol dehydrogenase-like predicted oxidoreductase